MLREYLHAFIYTIVEMMPSHIDNSTTCLLALLPLQRFISIGLRANSGLTCALSPCLYVCRYVGLVCITYVQVHVHVGATIVREGRIARRDEDEVRTLSHPNLRGTAYPIGPRQTRSGTTSPK